MKKKLSVRAVASLLLSALLFCMPIGAVMANSGNTVDAYAEESSAEGETEEGTGTEGSKESEESTETEPGESGGESEEETEGGTVSGNEIPKLECTCKEKCTQYSIDKDCEACKEDYSLCEYVNPNVKITISTPSGWHNDTTKVHISIEDVAHSGNFTIKTVQAKVAQNGSWTDITEDMYVEISENTTVYVLVTDQRGKTYEKNRYIKCFDFTKPTLNAAVSDGLLSVQAHDTDSGIKAVYVNGYEFYPEDGSTLYEEEAWELSEQARSLWLRLTFAGEYSESMSPVQIQGRKYLPMFPARDGVYTIEQVREKFLAVFSKEFTDKTLNAAIASKDLLEYNGNVYAAYRKNRGKTSYNSWADHVRDDGDGKFTVVMGGSMPPNGGTVYVELPTEKNAAGKFVFTDYPYWDQSE
jgi:hypothetical protein